MNPIEERANSISQEEYDAIQNRAYSLEKPLTEEEFCICCIKESIVSYEYAKKLYPSYIGEYSKMKMWELDNK